MNKLLIILSLLIAACSNNESHLDVANGDKHMQHDSTAVPIVTLRLNNNNTKWKTDDVTRKNVSAMARAINDSNNIGASRKQQLVEQLQGTINTLVQQCTMKGPDHDALHLWVEQVMHDLKSVKTSSDDAYPKSYAALKGDVENFYVYFE